MDTLIDNLFVKNKLKFYVSSYMILGWIIQAKKIR